jgi:hypothetical protein
MCPRPARRSLPGSPPSLTCEALCPAAPKRVARETRKDSARKPASVRRDLRGRPLIVSGPIVSGHNVWPFFGSIVSARQGQPDTMPQASGLALSGDVLACHLPDDAFCGKPRSGAGTLGSGSDPGKPTVIGVLSYGGERLGVRWQRKAVGLDTAANFGLGWSQRPAGTRPPSARASPGWRTNLYSLG